MRSRTAAGIGGRLLLGAAVALASLSGAPLQAQVVQGRVLHRDTRQPVALALVLLVDGRGQTVSRALTRETGRFVFAERPAGPGATIRAERIGLGVVTTPLPDAESDEIELLLSSVPVQIEGLVVEAEDRCPADPNDERLAQAWSQFRPLLESLEHEKEGSQRSFEVSYAEVELSADGEDVEATRVDTLFVSEAVPFRTEDPAVLAEDGFVVQESSSTVTYFAPDAKVLLSAEFIASHCYRLPETQDRWGYLEIAFAPRSPEAERDIGGVLALPIDGSSLPMIEFYFTSHPWGYDPDPRLGGFVELAPTDTGWVVSEWELRVPGPPMVSGRTPPIRAMTAYRGRLLRVLLGGG